MKRIIWFISVWWWSTITWFLSTHFLPAANTCKHCGCKLLADDCSSPSWVRANTAPNEWFQSFLFFGDDILLPSFYPDLICGMLAELFPCFSLSLSLSLSLSISIYLSLSLSHSQRWEKDEEHVYFHITSYVRRFPVTINRLVWCVCLSTMDYIYPI